MTINKSKTITTEGEGKAGASETGGLGADSGVGGRAGCNNNAQSRR